MVHFGALAWGQEQAGMWEGAWVPGLAVWSGVQGFPQASPLLRGRDGSPHPPRPPCGVLGRSEDMEGGGLQRNVRALLRGTVPSPGTCGVLTQALLCQ